MHATTVPADQHVAVQPKAGEAHKDNIFGVCNAIGQDFGFNPLLLRLAFAVALLASPEITLTAYAGLGVVVLVSRLATRRWRAKAPIAVQQPWSPALPAIRVADRIDATKTLEPAL